MTSVKIAEFIQENFGIFAITFILLVLVSILVARSSGKTEQEKLVNIQSVQALVALLSLLSALLGLFVMPQVQMLKMRNLLSYPMPRIRSMLADLGIESTDVAWQ